MGIDTIFVEGHVFLAPAAQTAAPALPRFWGVGKQISPSPRPETWLMINKLYRDARPPIGMNVQNHWEQIYGTKAPEAVSWYRPHLEISLRLIERVAPDFSTSIIDVGGGESTLADDLLAHGYKNVTVLDVSQTAIDVSKTRLGEASENVKWLVCDITKAESPPRAYDVWHDRAVFHFLTAIDERTAYVLQVARAVKPGGHVIVSTFGLEGPTKCSGLDVVRYDAESLHKEFGLHFHLLDHTEELHRTPFGTVQQFLYCLCRVE
jgi:2-polyprenyl-3-methyl-5-hydroxy-6-metoxy-1,4-benzoquinol methylase